MRSGTANSLSRLLPGQETIRFPSAIALLLGLPRHRRGATMSLPITIGTGSFLLFGAEG